MLKKIFIAFLLTLFITSCGGGGSQVNDGLVMFTENKHFNFKIPKKWVQVTDISDILSKPKVGNIELAITSHVEKSEFLNSLVVLSEKLPDNSTTSIGYAHSLLLKTKETIPSMKNLQEKHIAFGEGEGAIASRLYTFTAKYSKNTPELRYIQTAHVCRDTGYVITIAVPTDIEDILKYEYLLSSFRCK